MASSKAQQCFAIGLYLFIFLGLGWSWPLLILLLCLPFTCIPALAYLLWIFYSDYGTMCLRGHTAKPAQKWAIWRWCADYFPMKLVKTAELPPDGSYLICNCPHGIFSYSAVFNFCTNATGFDELFPGLDCRGSTIRWNFKLPFVREVIALWGAVDSSYETLVKVLRRGSGSTVMLEVGGTAESLYSKPHTYDVILKKRKGFVRVALRAGASLVPVIAFGETNTYDTYDVHKLHKAFQHLLMRIGGYTLPEFSGAFLKFFPHATPITTVVGAPIAVPRFEGDFHSEEGVALVDKYHKLFSEGVMAIWEQHKDVYAADRTKELTFVE